MSGSPGSRDWGDRVIKRVNKFVANVCLGLMAQCAMLLLPGPKVEQEQETQNNIVRVDIYTAQIKKLGDQIIGMELQSQAEKSCSSNPEP